MQMRRLAFNTMPPSPLRQLYGVKKGSLLLPLDNCIFDDDERMRLPSVPGALNGASVVDSAGGEIGTVSSYDWPPADMANVRPLVFIHPSGSLDINSVPNGTAPKLVVKVGDDVEIVTLNDDFEPVPTGIHGSITALPDSRIYPDLGHRVTAYIVHFNQTLNSPIIGARVRVSTTGELLGMLMATQNQLSGRSDTLVFPAHLI